MYYLVRGTAESNPVLIGSSHVLFPRGLEIHETLLSKRIALYDRQNATIEVGNQSVAYIPENEEGGYDERNTVEAEGVSKGIEIEITPSFIGGDETRFSQLSLTVTEEIGRLLLEQNPPPAPADGTCREIPAEAGFPMVRTATYAMPFRVSPTIAPSENGAASKGSHTTGLVIKADDSGESMFWLELEIYRYDG